MTVLEFCAKARAAEDAINAMGRDPEDHESNEVTAMLAKAYRSVPKDIREISDLAELLLQVEGDIIDPLHREAIVSIRDGAFALESWAGWDEHLDPSVACCKTARSRERAFRKLSDADADAVGSRCSGEDAIALAYMTRPSSPAGIAALAGLVLYVEGDLLEPEVAIALKSIHKGAKKIASAPAYTGRAA